LIYASAHVANDFANIKYDSAFVTGADIDKHLQDASTFAKPLIISVCNLDLYTKGSQFRLGRLIFLPNVAPLMDILDFQLPSTPP